MATQHSKPNPTLQRLDALVGEWQVEASVGGQTMAGVRMSSAWTEGGAFLVQHQDTEGEPPADVPQEWLENSPFPVTTMMGLDDSSEQFSMLYADGRGVYRVYQMTLSDGVWKLWRDAPGFFQRFTGTFSDDGTTITAQWEFSPDGIDWRLDFDLTYRKIG